MISALPEELGNMTSLVSLNISGNCFTSFPKGILRLKQLKQLWLSKNAFKDFPIDDIKNNLVGLKSLYTFGPIGNDGSDINQEYASLQRHKGNSITQLDLLALKAKGKRRNLNNNDIGDKVEMKRKSIFISYCHEDDIWLSKLNLVLKTMEYEGLNFDSWSDKRISTGDIWKTEIETALDNADIAILLVSNHFLASKFIREQEIPPLLQKAKNNGTVILPVIVGLCRFIKSPISVYQSVNAPDKPLNAMSAHEVEKVLYDLTIEIDKRISIA